MKLDRAGWPFVLALCALGIAAYWFSPLLSVLAAGLLAFTLNFFRDPERVTPGNPGGLVAPADGRIIRADGARISIFMNVFNVHVCRSPIAWRVTVVTHEPGRFLAAMKSEASEQNERTAIVVAPKDGPPVRFVLVAGLIARRIVCRVTEGREICAGERVGIIRFG